MKPKGLYTTFIVMCLMNLTGFAFVNPQVGSVSGQFAFIGLIIAFSYVVLWYYWRGKNWARILVIVASVVALVNLFFLPMFSFAQRIVIIAEACLAVFLLWWLNTRAVRAYFGGETELKV